jgi:hypothetical protein
VRQPHCRKPNASDFTTEIWILMLGIYDKNVEEYTV